MEVVRVSEVPYTLSVKLNDFTVWRHTWRKIWVNCVVLTGNSAGLTTVISSIISHRDSRKPTFSSVYLPTPRWHHLKPLNLSSHDIFLFKYHFLLHILRFRFFFSDNITADVASKGQTTALFLSIIATCTRRHKELKKLTNLMGNLCCAREHSVQFFVQLLNSETGQFNMECMWAL
jgi:hypothetical protein